MWKVLGMIAGGEMGRKWGWFLLSTKIVQAGIWLAALVGLSGGFWAGNREEMV